MGYDGERVARAVKTRLEDNLADELDTVAGLWAGTEAVTLPDPVVFYLGHKPTVLELPSTSFPFVAVVAAGQDPRSGLTSIWGEQSVTFTTFVDFFVVAEDEATVNVIAQRYAEAIVRVMQAQVGEEGYQQRDYQPPVSLSEASRHKKTANADMLDTSDVDFIQGGRVELVFEGG
jgi:hypothetical protein